MEILLFLEQSCHLYSSVSYGEEKMGALMDEL